MGFPKYTRMLIVPPPLLEFLKPDVYFQILKQIDLAVMYPNRKQGGGTINILVYLGKPIVMKKTSLFYHLKEIKVKVFPHQDLEGLILNKIEFTEDMSKNNKKIASRNLSLNSTISSIDKLFTILEK